MVHLLCWIPLLSTVAVAKPAIKSYPVVTQSSPHQRHAEPPTLDSPTSSVLSPIKKRRLMSKIVRLREIMCDYKSLLTRKVIFDMTYVSQS